MFHMFDKLLLISEGYPVYYGKARESMEYFSSLRFVPEIAMNPAEFLLDLTTGQVNDISLPEDLRTPRGSLEFEKDVIKVSENYLYMQNNMYIISRSFTNTNICLLWKFFSVFTIEVQSCDRTKRKG